MVENRTQRPEPGMLAGNLAQPIKLADFQIDGISASSAKAGESVQVWTRLYLTSDEAMFHSIVGNFAAHISSCARQAGHPIDLERAATVLLVVKPDKTGDLWVDTAAMSMRVMPKRPMPAGSIFFESDIADVLALSFPLVTIDPMDRVICIIRVGWRFAFFADFNHTKVFSISDMERDLGTLYRRLKYADLYDTMADIVVVDSLMREGWFPFAEILGAEFLELASACRAGWALSDVEAALLTKFDPSRLERMFSRWMTREHFAGKETLLRSALRAYSADDPVPVLKIALTEIEGILREAHRKKHGKGAKLKRLLSFAVEAGHERTGAPDTLLLTEAFGRYLKSYVFADFDPASGNGKAGSRHAVGHGAATSDSYTMIRALQALLTLDQLAFYT